MDPSDKFWLIIWIGMATVIGLTATAIVHTNNQKIVRMGELGYIESVPVQGGYWVKPSPDQQPTR